MNIFLDDSRRLRTGYRFVIFWVAVIVIGSSALGVLINVIRRIYQTYEADRLLDSRVTFLTQGLVFFLTAFLVGWACAALLERLGPASVGWALHRRWFRDLVMGFALGGLTVTLAALLAGIRGGYQVEFSDDWSSVTRTVLVSGVIFLIAAAGEEAVFRGYGLQTMVRANLAWVGIIMTSVPFALGHTDNPNVSPWFTVTNTILAGIWLSIAYLKTRSLWFALGLHWSWNWIMGAIMGIPVSGITQATPEPVMHIRYGGPSWLSGGAYGLEGGLACTVAIVVSTIVIWRMRVLEPAEETLAAQKPAVNTISSADLAAPPIE